MATISLNSNIASLSTQRRLAETTKRLSTINERLASGQRINRAGDDAAGLAISTSLNTDSRLFGQAIRNVNDGVSLITIAEGALTELSNITLRQQELAEQAANGTMTITQRRALTAEVRALGEEFNRIVSTTSFNGRVITDASADAAARIAAGIGSAAAISFGIGSELSRSVGDGTFGTSFQLPLVLGSGWLVSGADFNEDGIFDVINHATGTTTAVIMQSNGDGTFAVTKTLSITSYADVGDLNNDGHSDLAGVSSDNKTILTWLNQGDGTFISGTSISSSVNAIGLVLADINNDGRDDILATRSNQLDLYLSTPTGTFVAAPAINVSANQRSVHTGDFNGDSYLDVAYTQAGSCRLLWGDGHGNFSQPQDTGLPPLASGQSSGDVNGDGIDDLVLIAAGFSPQLYLGTSSGTFSSPISLLGTTSRSLITDVNGDGKSEVVYDTGSQTDILHLSTSPDGSLTVAAVTTCDYILDAIAGDLNGDGAIDLMGSDGTYPAGCYGNPHQVTTVQQLSLFTQTNAREALETLSAQLNRVTSEIGSLGSTQSRLSAALSNLASSREGYDSAASRISDADVAEEAAGLVRTRILQQATAAVLAQANQAPALALKLLSGG